jgi:electron transport complex protein RnfE
MILPPGGFIMLGLILLFFNWLTEKRENAIAQFATTERNVI